MEKIKQFIENEKGKNVLTVLLIILVGLGSFELGRLSKMGSSTGIKVQYPDKVTSQPASVISSTVTTSPVAPKATITGKSFFASNRGSKYYSLNCSAGKTIKKENRIYFSSALEAENAGYELSSSCR